jgi:hypothetical protein
MRNAVVCKMEHTKTVERMDNMRTNCRITYLTAEWCRHTNDSK